MRAMTLRLPDEVHEALRKEAYESRRSIQKIVEEAIQDRRNRRSDIPFYQLLAEAWDEGYGDDNDVHTPRTNPYRDGSK